MENYIVINGKKAELTDEQLKALGIGVKKKRNNPFNSELKFGEKYYSTHSVDGAFSTSFEDEFDKDFMAAANSFNDKDFANQVYLHELLNRKLLKYAWDNEAEDCEWDKEDNNPHYYIYFEHENCYFDIGVDSYGHKQNAYFSKVEVAIQAIKDVIEPFMKEHPEFVW